MPNETFQEWFCLKNRATFTIDPRINPDDAQFYFGRAEIRDRIRRQVSRAFLDPQVPKMMVYGPYGCGKTQTLYHIAWDLVANKPSSCNGKPHVVHLDIEVNSKSGADLWHLQLMESLGMQTVQGWIQELYGKAPNFEAEIAKLSQDPNIIQGFKQLRGSGEIAFTTWRWLAGQKLASKELQEIKVTRNMSDVGAGDLVAILQSIGNLARTIGYCLMFFVDEMEELLNVKTGDAAESWHQYARKLSENANSSVGFVLGFKADTLDEAPRMLIRQDIISRLGKNCIIDLPPLPSTANVKLFLEEMLARLVDQTAGEKLVQGGPPTSVKGTFPFTTSAFELLCDYACQDPIKSTPRNIIKAISECAIAAWDAVPRKRLVDDAIINEIAPIVFG
jgi:DNA polymerase III delta prime subunit